MKHFSGSSGSAWRIGAVLALITLVLQVLSVVSLAVDHYLFPAPATRDFLNVNVEQNLPTWWNTSLLLTVALLSLVAGSTEVQVSARRAWWVIAAGTLYLSLDEASHLHERLGDAVRAAEISVPTAAWLLPGVFVAAAGFVVLVAVGRSLPQPARRPLLASLILYATGAIVIEAVNGVLSDQRLWFFYWIGTSLEETAEMAACVLAATSILVTLERARAAGAETQHS